MVSGYYNNQHATHQYEELMRRYFSGVSTLTTGSIEPPNPEQAKQDKPKPNKKLLLLEDV